MTHRQLFQQIMYYGDFDRMPVLHWAVWDETVERWRGEGLPAFDAADINLQGPEVHAFLGTQPLWSFLGADCGLFPLFEEEDIEVTDEYRVFRDSGGVVVKDWKGKSSIPHQIEFTLKGAEDWPQYKERLQPDPARIPANLDNHIAQCLGSGLAVVVGVGSMMGWIRNWMGVQNMSYLMYEAPDVYADMVDTIAELSCWSLNEILPIAKAAGLTPDLGFGWEDICGSSGPLVSPPVFDAYVAPGYRKIRGTLEAFGIDLLGIDSDGFVEPLLPHWLNAGVNVMFPVEPGTWGATPEHMRERFGRELRIIGGFDKLALEKNTAAIDAELESHMALMKEGGFLLLPDHFITPGTPLANYQYYLDRVRALRF